MLRGVRGRRIKSIANISKNVVKSATTALSLVVATLIYKQVTSTNNRVSRLEGMVSGVNAQIDAITTKDDIEKARTARNNALKVLNDAESALIRIKKIIDSINKIVKTILLVVKVLKIAINAAVGPAKTAIKLALNKIEQILHAVQVVLSAASGILGTLIELIREIRARLKQIGDLLDALIQNPDIIGSEDLTAVLNTGYGQLGMLEETYKGWRFEIREEFNKQFVIQGNKRRYAVAINKDNTPVLKSEASFTLDPEVLVGELKLQIDDQNLNP
jgi:hypothetical protein